LVACVLATEAMDKAEEILPRDDLPADIQLNQGRILPLVDETSQPKKCPPKWNQAVKVGYLPTRPRVQPNNCPPKRNQAIKVGYLPNRPIVQPNNCPPKRNQAIKVGYLPNRPKVPSETAVVVESQSQPQGGNKPVRPAVAFYFTPKRAELLKKLLTKLRPALIKNTKNKKPNRQGGTQRRNKPKHQGKTGITGELFEDVKEIEFETKPDQEIMSDGLVYVEDEATTQAGSKPYRDATAVLEELLEVLEKKS